MKCYFVLIACLLYLLSASSISAEYYHYVDKDGVKHFTDDISDIPEDQKPKLSIHQSIQTPPKKEAPPEKPAVSPESLVIKKDELDNEYKAIVKKRETLNKEKKSIGEKKYNEIAAQLNIEIKQYQEKSQSYEKLVEQYNEQIKPSDKN